MSCGAVGGRHSIVTEKHSLTVKCPCGAYWDVVNTIKVAGCPRCPAEVREKYFSLFREQGGRIRLFKGVCPWRGELLPPLNKLVGGSAIRVIIKMSRGHDRWIWGKGTENNCFSSLVFVFGELARHGSATQKQSPPVEI